jgi:DNA-binding transcriptional MerR regulator
MINEPRTFSLDELSALAAISRRTIRFYIQQGLVDRPEGSSRRVAHYTHRHLEQLLIIRRWQDAGLSLDRIRDIIHEQEEGPGATIRPRKSGTIEVWSHIMISDGLEIHIEPSKSGLSPERIRELVGEVVEAFQRIQGRET